MNAKARNTLTAVLAAVVGATVGVSAAEAANRVTLFCENAYIDSGRDCTASSYEADIVRVSGTSTGSATTGVWVVNSRRERISRDDYCESPGCVAQIDGARWSGFANVHNHSGFGSRFTAAFEYF